MDIVPNKALSLSLSLSLSIHTHTHTPGSLDLKWVYEAPFLESAGRLPLGQASKREEAGK